MTRPARPPYTFRRYVVPSLIVTVPMAVVLAMRVYWGWAETQDGIVGLAVVYLISGVVTSFVGEYHDWRRARAQRALDRVRQRSATPAA